MALRQYIGARYVPKFSDVNGGEWDDTYTYEPLTIVKHGNDYYTSKKEVPTGVAITNTEYWVLTGNYNGAVSSLDDRVTALESEISEYSNLDDRVTALEDDMEVKDHIMVFGDSWTDEGVDVNVQATSVLSKRFNATVKTYGRSGTGFDRPNGYDEQLAVFKNDLDNNIYDLNRIRCLILVCGLNDYQRQDPVITASDFTDMLNDWVIKARNIVGDRMSIYWFHNYSIANDLTLTNTTTFYNQWIYYNTVKNACSKYICASDTFGWVDSWRNDTHPDKTGSTQYYENVANVIQGLPVNVRKYQSVKGTWDTNKFIQFDYWYRGCPILDVELSGSTNDIKGITTAVTVAYDHTPPARFDNYISFEGLRAYGSNYTGFTIEANNTTFLGGYTSSGYYHHRISI